MAQIDALSSLYARSLYELADEAGGRAKIEEVSDELEQICELARSDQSFGEFLATPIIDKTKRSESLRDIFSNRVTDLTLRFLLVLNDKERLDRIESINQAFDALLQKAFGRVEVDVYTAQPIDETQLSMIRERVQSAINKEPVLHPYTEPLMIGGIRLRIGDQLIDGSVESQLRRLRDDVLSGGAVIRERAESIIEEQTDERA